MKLFKNEVGRPSNETLKKRKIAIIAIVIAAVLLVGGVTFALVKTFKPVEGSGKNAEANKFVVVKKSDTCYTIYAPTNAKYWGLMVTYTNLDSKSKKTHLNVYHDNDGKNQQNLCFSRKESTNERYTINVKWNKNKKHKTYGKINSWKPVGYSTNIMSGWAYKNYDFKWDTLKLNESSNQYGGERKATISFEHSENQTLYYSFTTYNNGKVAYKQSCSSIEAGKTKSFTLDVSEQNSSRYATIALFRDNKCKNTIESKTTKTYYYSALSDSGKLIVIEPTKQLYETDTNVEINFKHNQHKMMYYSYINYNNGTAGYTQACSPIAAGDVKKFTLTVSKKLQSRYSIINLFADKKCKNKVDSVTTKKYSYLNSFKESSAALKLIEKSPEKNVSADGKPIVISIVFSHTGNKDLYYKYTAYRGNQKSTTICSMIEKNKYKGYNYFLSTSNKEVYAFIELFSDDNCKNRIDSKYSNKYVYYNDAKAPTITKACQNGGYVYVTANDDYRIKEIGWVPSGTSCSKLTAANKTAVNLGSIKNKKINAKLTTTKKVKACVFDYSGHVKEKNVSKSC